MKIQFVDGDLTRVLILSYFILFFFSGLQTFLGKATTKIERLKKITDKALGMNESNSVRQPKFVFQLLKCYGSTLIYITSALQIITSIIIFVHLINTRSKTDILPNVSFLLPYIMYFYIIFISTVTFVYYPPFTKTVAFLTNLSLLASSVLILKNNIYQSV